jgi:hypothetical protein
VSGGGKVEGRVWEEGLNGNGGKSVGRSIDLRGEFVRIMWRKAKFWKCVLFVSLCYAQALIHIDKYHRCPK